MSVAVNKIPIIDDKLLNINRTLVKLTAEPEQFLIAQPEKCRDIEQMLQEMYGATIEADQNNLTNPEILPELVLEEMDVEQIWQQLELRNNLALNDMITKTAKLLALKETKLEVHLKEDDDAEDITLNEEDDDDDDDEDDNDDGDDVLQNLEEDETDNEDDEDDDHDDIYQKISARKDKSKRISSVEDKFFKLDEMEAFLEAEDAKDERKQSGKVLTTDQDGIDYFAENLGEFYDSDEENSNPGYKDFFDMEEELDLEQNQKGGHKNKGKQIDYFANNRSEVPKNEESGEDEDNEHDDIRNGIKNFEQNSEEDHEENDDKAKEDCSDSDNSASKQQHEPQSSFQLRQGRLEQRMRNYELEVLGEKPWQLKGEIQAMSRPKNSLLEEVLEFESTVRAAPLITEETTRCLEDIIKQRIRNQAWDDVERIVKPTSTPQDYRKRLVLDQEKSKESLAHIYEKEYQRQMEKSSTDRDPNDTEEPKEHQEIRKLMRVLFIKLDALSNFHFTPKPVAPEPKIITNTPAVAMEEVAPIAVSNAKLLAPEEVFRGPKYELVGKSERSKTDKNRALRKKKSKQRAIHNALEARDLERQKKGMPLTKKEESAKLMRKLTKQRNVEKITSSNDKGALKSSKAFFSTLQDQATTGMKPTKKKQNVKSLSAKKFKL